MAVGHRGTVAAVAATNSSTAVAITLPGGILGGECIRVTIGWNNGGAGAVTCTTPSGYTLLDTLVRGSASVSTFYKVAAGTVGAASADAGATVAATLSSGKAWAVVAKVFTGSDPVNPIHAHAVDSTGSVVITHAAPPLAVTAAGCWIEEGAFERGASTSWTAPALVSSHPAAAGPGAYNSPALIATADTGATVAIGTRGGDIWTATAATSVVVTWVTAIQPATASQHPTAAFSGGSTGGYTVTVDGTGSSAVSPATLTAYDWDWGDGSAHGIGSTASHSYAAAGPGTYTITLTVTDSNSATDQTSADVTVAAPSAVVLPLSVLATGFVPLAGTELEVFTDTSESTFDTSPVGGGTKTYFYAEIAKPLAGQGLYFETLTDRLGSSSGSFTAKLYQDTAKTVLISTVSGTAIPDGTAAVGHPDSAVTPPVVVNFPAADIASMTDFSTPTVEVTEVVS